MNGLVGFTRMPANINHKPLAVHCDGSSPSRSRSNTPTPNSSRASTPNLSRASTPDSQSSRERDPYVWHFYGRQLEKKGDVISPSISSPSSPDSPVIPYDRRHDDSVSPFELEDEQYNAKPPFKKLSESPLAKLKKEKQAAQRSPLTPISFSKENHPQLPHVHSVGSLYL